MRIRHICYTLLTLVMLCGASHSSAKSQTQPPAKEDQVKEEILTTNQTEARFDGIQYVPCRFRTALCPDKCGHAKTLAIFTITKYLAYEKKGKYGDDKQDVFFVDVGTKIAPDSPQCQIRRDIASLTVGQKVLLNWNHLYVTEKGNSYPKRIVTLLKICDGAKTPTNSAPIK